MFWNSFAITFIAFIAQVFVRTHPIHLRKLDFISPCCWHSSCVSNHVNKNYNVSKRAVTLGNFVSSTQMCWQTFQMNGACALASPMSCQKIHVPPPLPMTPTAPNRNLKYSMKSSTLVKKLGSDQCVGSGNGAPPQATTPEDHTRGARGARGASRRARRGDARVSTLPLKAHRRNN